MGEAIRIDRIDSFLMRADVGGLPTSSLGAMNARNGLLVRIEDAEGAFGWGEIWCNFPPHAGQSRQHLLEAVIAPELLGKKFSHAGDARPSLEARWGRMAVHVGEPGPFGHCIAGIDMALWDLQARRNGQSLSAFLNSQPADSVKVYSSTLNPARAPDLATELFASGHRAFKLKVGRDPQGDENLVRGVREALGQGPAIMIDANQSWSVEQAAEAINRLATYDLLFAEEPISATAPLAAWKALAGQADVALAAGENICADDDYAAHIEAGALTFYQPDVAKWGGIGGCFAAGRLITENGYVYCPHFMGTAVGLAASVHLLAAVGGEGFVELDSNDNPLRTELCNFDLGVAEGRVQVPRGDGIGVIPDEEALRRYGVT
jgi:D-galactarolactone cycloisomerase